MKNMVFLVRTFLVAVLLLAVAGCGPSKAEKEAENRRRIGALVSMAMQRSGTEREYDPSKLEETKKGEEWTYIWTASTDNGITAFNWYLYTCKVRLIGEFQALTTCRKLSPFEAEAFHKRGI